MGNPYKDGMLRENAVVLTDENGERAYLWQLDASPRGTGS